MKFRTWYATIASTLALLVALTGVGAVAAGKLNLISGKQIKNNSIRAKKVKFPKATPVRPGGARASRVIAQKSVSDQYEQVAVMGTYAKRDPTSVLQLTWTGTARADFSPCIFQLRVDGQPPIGGGGEVYVQNSNTVSVSAQGLFTALSPGPHEVAVYARLPVAGGSHPCTVGPEHAQIAQTVNAAELIQ